MIRAIARVVTTVAGFAFCAGLAFGAFLMHVMDGARP